MMSYLYRYMLWIFIIVCLAACQMNSARDASSIKASAANTELGIYFMREGDLAHAMYKLTKAVNQNPVNSSAHNAIALLYVRLGEMQDAEEHFRKAVRIDPKNSAFHVSYGAFLCQRNQLEAAEKHFNEALNNPLYPRREIAYSNAGNCALRAGNNKKADEYFRGALRVNPKFSPALYQMARLNVMKKNYLSGRAYLQRYAEVSPPSAKTLWLSVQVEKELGDKDAAASHAMLLKDRFPDSDEVKKLHEMEKNGRSSHN